MEVLYVLVPLGVIVAIASAALFWLAADGGQFDELDSQGGSILGDEHRP